MWWRVAADIFIVALFVVIGRDTHNEGNAFGDVLETMAPFAIAVVGARVLPQVKEDPDGLSTGFLVGSFTVVVGIAIRRVVFSGGIAPAFILVTALFLMAGTLGWRLAWRRFGPAEPAAGSAAERPPR